MGVAVGVAVATAEGEEGGHTGAAPLQADDGVELAAVAAAVVRLLDLHRRGE